MTKDEKHHHKHHTEKHKKQPVSIVKLQQVHPVPVIPQQVHQVAPVPIKPVAKQSNTTIIILLIIIIILLLIPTLITSAFFCGVNMSGDLVEDFTETLQWMEDATTGTLKTMENDINIMDDKIVGIAETTAKDVTAIGKEMLHDVTKIANEMVTEVTKIFK